MGAEVKEILLQKTLKISDTNACYWKEVGEEVFLSSFKDKESCKNALFPAFLVPGLW